MYRYDELLHISSISIYDRQDLVCPCPDWAISEETEYINLLLKISNKIKNKFIKEMNGIFGQDCFYCAVSKTHHRMLNKTKYDYINEKLPKSAKNLDIIRGTINCENIESLLEKFNKLLEHSNKLKENYQNNENNENNENKENSQNGYHLQIVQIDNKFLIKKQKQNQKQKENSNNEDDNNENIQAESGNPDSTEKNNENKENDNNDNKKKNNNEIEQESEPKVRFKMQVTTESGDVDERATSPPLEATAGDISTGGGPNININETQKQNKKQSKKRPSRIAASDILRSINEEYRGIIVNIVIDVPGKHKFRIDRELKDSLTIEFDSDDNSKNSLRMICELQFLLNDYFNIKKKMHLFEKIARSRNKNDLWAECAKYWL